MTATSGRLNPSPVFLRDWGGAAAGARISWKKTEPVASLWV
jgi:hypothetical protein